MNIFKLGDIIKCFNADNDGNDLYFIVTEIDSIGYCIRWNEYNTGGAINFKDVSVFEDKIFIFNHYEVEILSDYEKLVFQIKYAN